MKHMAAIAGACLLGGAAWATPATPVLYGSVYSQATQSSRLVVVNTSSGATTAVGPLWTGITAGLGTYNGLWGYQIGPNILHKIDPSTGAILSSSGGPGGVALQEGGLDFRSDGLAFLTSGTSLYTLSGGGAPLTTGIAFDGLAFSPANVLYGVSQSTGLLYTINQSTGAPTFIGATGLTTGPFGGLAFRSDGTLFWGSPSSLYQLNPGTGTASLIGGFGGLQPGEFMTGLSFESSAPEPAAWALMAAGLGLVALRRLRSPTL